MKILVGLRRLDIAHSEVHSGGHSVNSGNVSCRIIVLIVGRAIRNESFWVHLIQSWLLGVTLGKL